MSVLCKRYPSVIISACLLFIACVGSHEGKAQSVSNLSVTSGPINTAVTITGSGFGATQGGSAVTFNGTVATATSWSDSSIGVTVPAGATTGPVVVTVGGVNSNSVVFTVTPYIANLSLKTGPVQMGFSISGTSFGAQQGSSSVNLGSITLPANNLISWSDTSITVSVPPGATTGNVVVTVNGQPSNSVTFTVVAPFSCN